MTRFAGIHSFRGQPASAFAQSAQAAYQRAGITGLETVEANPAFALTDNKAALARLDALTIVGDVRIDSRRAVLDRIENDVEATSLSDLALVLRAFKLKGPACLDWITGDFAFAIWDGNAGEWFCARDPFGIKPLYFIADGRRFIVANTADVLRAHVGCALNERAIADFLLIGMNPALDSSSFAEIHMLPPAHMLWSSSGQTPRTRQFWSLEPRPRLRRDTPFVEAFSELFESAVKRRLPNTGVASVALSGGLDSTAVAAFAVRHASGRTLKAVSLDDTAKSYTTHEAQMAAQTARHLGLEHIRVPHGEWSPPTVGSGINHPFAANPVMGIPASSTDVQSITRARCGDVILTGHGADPLFTPNVDYVAQLARRGKLGTLVGDWVRHIWTFRRRPPLYLHTARMHARRRSQAVTLPVWLKPDFVKRLDVAGRAEQLCCTGSTRRPAEPRPLAGRAGALAQLSGPFWPRLFESLDVGFQDGGRVEFRHPWFDLDVVNFMLGVPELPWCHDKYLLRHALRGAVPEPVRKRPKAVVKAEPEHQMLKPHYQRWGQALLSGTPLAEFVDRHQFTRLLRQADKLRPHEYGLLARPLYLGNWLADIGASRGGAGTL